MSVLECAFEPEVVLAVQTGRWPHRVDEALRQHVRACAICADSVLVASAFADADAIDDDRATREMRVPASGAMWVRAQMRARAEAARTATRPITVVQVAAFTTLAATAGALFGATSSWFQAWIGRIWTTVTAIDLRALPVSESVAASIAGHVVLVGVIVACIVLGPLAYLVAREE